MSASRGTPSTPDGTARHPALRVLFWTLIVSLYLLGLLALLLRARGIERLPVVSTTQPAQAIVTPAPSEATTEPTAPALVPTDTLLPTLTARPSLYPTLTPGP